MPGYLGFKILQALSVFFPLRIVYLLCATAGSLWFYFDGKKRRAVIDNLNQILLFSPHRGFHKEELLKKCSRQVFKNFCKYLCEFLRFRAISWEWIADNVEVIGRENLDNALKLGRGAIALTAHLGNWELGAMTTAALGYKVNAVAMPHRDKGVDGLFVSQRRGAGVNVIEVGNAVKGILAALQRNEIAALPADFDPTDKGISVNFFGRPVRFSRGPFAVAARTRSPIVPCVMVRGGRKHFQLIFESPIFPMEEGKVEKEALEVLERLISSHPGQWCIFRKIWE